MASKRDIITSPRREELEKKRRKRRSFRLITISICFIVLIVALSFLSRYRQIVIKDIAISGTQIVDSDDVEALVRKNLSGSYIGIFARANTFIFPEKKIRRDLEKTFPRIEELSIRRSGLTGLSIEIKERAGSYLWCGATIPETGLLSGDGCFFVNGDGYIFDNAPYFSGSVYFKFYTPIEGNTETPLTNRVLSPEMFADIISFSDGIATLGFEPIAFTIISDDEYDLYLRHGKNGIAPKIMFRKDSDLDKLFNNLASAMDKPAFREEIMSQYDTLSYIDLRFNNKVVYKVE